VQAIGIAGSTTGAAIPATYVGQYLESFNDTSVTAGATGAWNAVGTLTLTAGEWDVWGQVLFLRNSATFSSVDCQVGISGAPTSTAPTEPLVTTRNLGQYGSQLNTFTNFTLATPIVRVSSNGTDIVVSGVTTAGTQIINLKSNTQSYS